MFSFAVEVAFAMFQVDIEQLTLTLIRKVLPRILADPLNFEKLSNPRGHALAKLTVWCIAATLTSHTSSRGNIPYPIFIITPDNKLGRYFTMPNFNTSKS